jgi:hypothetical protein
MSASTPEPQNGRYVCEGGCGLESAPGPHFCFSDAVDGYLSRDCLEAAVVSASPEEGEAEDFAEDYGLPPVPVSAVRAYVHRNGSTARNGPSRPRTVSLQAASKISSEPARWLWETRLPLRGLTCVAGEKGLGKSLLTNALMVAAVTTGTLEGELFGTPKDVLVVTAEDDWRSIVKPRLQAHGADLDRVHRLVVHDSDGEVLLTLPDDVAQLEAQIKDRDVGLIVVDPIGAFIPERTNSNGEAPVRRLLAPLAAMADRQNLAVVVVMHLTKDDSKRLIQRVSGAGAFVNACRSVLCMVKDPNDPNGEQGNRRLLVHVATNWGTYAPTLAVHVDSKIVPTDDGGLTNIGVLEIDGESDVTVEDVGEPKGPDKPITNMPDLRAADSTSAAVIGGSASCWAAAPGPARGSPEPWATASIPSVRGSGCVGSGSVMRAVWWCYVSDQSVLIREAGTRSPAERGFVVLGHERPRRRQRGDTPQTI